jgi:hypothetical protein
MIREKLTERRSFEIVPCVPPRIRAKKIQESSPKRFGVTYIGSPHCCHFQHVALGGTVALEDAVMDLHIGIFSMNSSTLEVACGPPGIGAKTIRKVLERASELLT